MIASELLHDVTMLSQRCHNSVTMLSHLCVQDYCIKWGMPASHPRVHCLFDLSDLNYTYRTAMDSTHRQMGPSRVPGSARAAGAAADGKLHLLDVCVSSPHFDAVLGNCRIQQPAHIDYYLMSLCGHLAAFMRNSCANRRHCCRAAMQQNSPYEHFPR